MQVKEQEWPPAEHFLVIVCIKDTKADMLILVFKSSGGIICVFASSNITACGIIVSAHSRPQLMETEEAIE